MLTRLLLRISEQTATGCASVTEEATRRLGPCLVGLGLICIAESTEGVCGRLRLLTKY